MLDQKLPRLIAQLFQLVGKIEIHRGTPPGMPALRPVDFGG
jgi:hypothetical protein